jgi:predicted ribosomally synthesized peptide with SipW-like signal peptide
MHSGGNNAMSKRKKVLRTILVAGVLSALAALATFSAFSSQTDNPGNNVTAGTVALTDNDGGTAAYNVSNTKPGQSSTPFCIRVAYSGSLDADLKMYTPSAIGSLGQYVNLKVEPGSQAVPNTNCAGFVADASGAVFDAALNTFPTSYATGVSDYPGSAATKWVNTDAVVYRVTATLSAGAPDVAQGLTTGSHTIRFEARNQ